MRQFVVVGHDVPTTPAFSLDDLAGGGGRLDLIARCLIDGLLHSHGIRTNTRVWIVLDDTVTVRFEGETLRNLHPDERSAAALLRSALERRDDAIGHESVLAAPGIELWTWGLAATLDHVEHQGTIIRLGPDGEPVAETNVPDSPIFVLSDTQSFTTADRGLLDKEAEETYSLGPIAVHTNQAIAVAHNWLDTEGYRSY